MATAADLITQVNHPDDKITAPQSDDNTPKKASCWGLFCCLPCRPAPKQNIALQNGTAGSAVHTQGSQQPAANIAPCNFLLPPLEPGAPHKKTLVLDLDETLVHSSFKPIPDADFHIQIELENTIHTVYVRKRPGVDNFLLEVYKIYEVVIFTASLAKYADPLLDILDPSGGLKSRLFREGCVQHYGNYVKDLRQLGRPLKDTILIDNSPFSYMFQPDNAIPITSWFSDQSDRQLYELLPFLQSIATVDDVCQILQRKNFTLTNAGLPQDHQQQQQQQPQQQEQEEQGEGEGQAQKQ